MQNKKIRIGPLLLTTTLTTNLVCPAVTSLTGPIPTGLVTQPYLLLKHIRITNLHASIAATFSLWVGTTGINTAGAEFMGKGTAIPVGGSVDWYGELRLDSTDFLVGGSNTATALSLQAEGEIGISG